MTKLKDDCCREQVGPGQPGAGGGGEANTTSNEGGGEGLALPKVGVNLPFKTLIAGTDISFDVAAETITINATGTGEANTTSNQGGGEGLALPKSGVDLPFKTLIAGTNVSLVAGVDTITINASGGGEANTSSNSGGGAGLAQAKVGVDLPFKSLIAGSNVTITEQADTVTIAATGGGGGGEGIQTFDPVICDSNEFMSNNTLGRLYCNVAVSPVPTSVEWITFLIAQNFAGGTIAVGIYDRDGIRLAYSTQQAAVLGINRIQLDNGGPVAILPSRAYYLAIESDINACAPIGLAQSYNPPVGANVPPLSFFVPNSRSIDPTGFPADVSSFFGQVGGEVRKYWLAASTTVSP